MIAKNLKCDFIRTLARIIRQKNAIRFLTVNLLNKWGGLAQWLASRTMDQGSLVRDLAAAQFVVALSKSHLPTLSTG